MGSPTDLTDLSDGSIHWLVFILLSNSINSFLRFFSHLLLIHSPPPTTSSSTSPSCCGGSTAVEDQLNLNRRSSCLYSGGGGSGGGSESNECVVCLCGLSDGELVRELDCRHVFHKGCLDGWLRRSNFTCPICRSSVEACGALLTAELEVR